MSAILGNFRSTAIHFAILENDSCFGCRINKAFLGVINLSELSTKQQEKVPVPVIVLILALLAANIVTGVLTIKKYTAKEPTVSVEVARLQGFMDQVNKNPEDINARLQLAYALQTMKENDKAREQYAEVLKLEEKNLAANYNLGVMAQSEENYAEAEKYYKVVLETKNNHVIAALGLAETYIAQKKYDDAIKVADQMLKHEPDKVDLYLLKARVYEKKGDKDKAIAQYEEVLKFVPDDPDATAGLEKLR